MIFTILLPLIGHRQVVVQNRDQLLSAKTEKLVGLFNGTKGYMNYVVDRQLKASDEPTHAEMMAKALETLNTNNTNGFFLMAEGSLVDYAAHAPDLAALVGEISQFNEMVKLAIEFAKADGQTLVIVTSDHDTMGLAVGEQANFDAFRKIKASHEYIGDQLVKGQDGVYTEESIRQVVSKWVGIDDLTKEEIAEIQEQKEGWLAGYVISIIAAHRWNFGTLPSHVRFIPEGTYGHSANMVPVYAYGPGAEAFDGVYDNTAIAVKIATLAGYDRFPTIAVSVKGKTLRLAAEAVYRQGSVWVPFRDILNGLGYGVVWDEAEGIARAQGNGNTLTVDPGTPGVKLNGGSTGTAWTPELAGGRLMVPVDMLAQVLGITYTWEPSLSLLSIN